MMKSKRVGWGIALVVVTILIAGLLGTTSRAGYESARYKVEEKDGSFEIRIYESHEVVTTTMNGENQNGSFGKLFRYISGANEKDQKIKMTTPVFMPATEDGKTREMQFVIPQDVSETGAPSPSNGAVKKKTMSGGKMAVIRYSGRSQSDQRKKKLKELRVEIESRGLSATGSPIFAGYDPPWTPALLRRNEVMLRLR
ncbi:MAG: heme-binding protein [Verrucomicrobiota bacterium]